MKKTHALWPPKFSHSCLTTTWLTRQLKKRLTRRTEKTPSSKPLCPIIQTSHMTWSRWLKKSLTTESSSSYSKPMQTTSSLALLDLKGARLEWLGISQRFWLVVWTLMHQSKQPDLSEPVMRSIFLLSPSKMSPDSSPGSSRNGAASFGMVPNCCLPMQKRRYRN